jgi:hypothetical protein
MRLYKAESAAVTVTDGSIGDSGLNVTVATVAARSLAFQVQPTNATAGATIAPAVRVEINDAFGNPSSSTESVTVASSAQTLSGTLTRSTVAGVATFNDLSMTNAGTYTLTATSTTLTGPTTTSFNIAPAAAAKLAFVSTAVSGPASTSAALGPITVQRQDAFGNTTTTGGAITVGLSSNSTGIVRFALTSGSTPVTSVAIPNGALTGTDFYYGDTKAASPTITASSSALTSATQQETITGAATTKLAFSSSPVSGPGVHFRGVGLSARSWPAAGWTRGG